MIWTTQSQFSITESKFVSCETSPLVHHMAILHQARMWHLFPFTNHTGIHWCRFFGHLGGTSRKGNLCTLVRRETGEE